MITSCIPYLQHRGNFWAGEGALRCPKGREECQFVEGVTLCKKPLYLSSAQNFVNLNQE